MLIFRNLYIKHLTIPFITALFVFLFFCSKAQVGNIKFERFGIEQGLSHTTVYNIIQDSLGFIWMGTEDGLNKYDGYGFKVYHYDHNNPNSIADNNVNNLRYAPDGNLWISSWGGGISRFNLSADRFDNFRNDPDNTNSLASDIVQCLYVDARGVVWAGFFDKGMDRYNPETGFWTHFRNNPNDENSLPHNRVWNIVQDANGFMWIGTSNGLCKFDEKNGHFTTFRNDPNNPNSLSHNQARVLFLDSKGMVWVGTQQQLNMLDPATGRFTRYGHDPNNSCSISNNVITTIYEDRNKNIWVGTLFGGLNCFDRKKNCFKVYKNDPTNQKSISSNDIRTIYEDRYGIIWVGTRGGGLNKFNNFASRFDHYFNDPNNKNSLSNSSVWSIFEDEDLSLWIGVSNGLNHLNRNTMQYSYYSLINEKQSEATSLGQVYSICGANDGILWIGTNRGLCRFDKATKTWKNYTTQPQNPKTISHNTVWNVKMQQHGNGYVLWLGTFGGGLNVFDPTTETFTRYMYNEKDSTSLSNNIVRTLYFDRQGYLWVGTQSGLNKMDIERGTFKRYLKKRNNNSLSHNSIWSLGEIKVFNDSILWIGTYGGGLNKFDPKHEQFTYYTVNDGLPNNIVYGILDDRNGFLWLSTNNGVSRFDSKNEIFRNYDVRDGLQSNDFNDGVYYKSPHGELFFGGVNGLNGFFPEQIKDNPYAPQVVITDFKIFNRSLRPGEGYLKRFVGLTDSITIKYSDYSFSIEFAALHYAIPGKNRYAYKMEGFDHDWFNTDASRRFVTYTNLDPGTYTFRVKAANSDGVWNNMDTKLFITIVPPFWRTKWFYTLVLILIIAGIYSFIVVRTYKLQQDKKRLEGLVKLRTAEIEQQKEELRTQRDLSEARRQTIMDSIHYARRIQNAILPPQDLVNSLLPEHFIMYKPRDVVSGDFYWVGKIDNLLYVAVADCTGHGVPGAFLNMLGMAFLNEIVTNNKLTDAAEILNQLRKRVIKSLHQTGRHDEASDGMDMALCIVNKSENRLQYAAAYNPVFVMRTVNNEPEVIHLRGDKMPIGIHFSVPQSAPFKHQNIEIKEGDMVYMFTDGMIDQVGGDEGKKFLLNNFKQLLTSIYTLPLPEQNVFINQTMDRWRHPSGKESHRQIDDMLMLGFKI